MQTLKFIVFTLLASIAPIKSVRAVEIDSPAPIFTLSGIDDSESLSTEKFKGKVILVDFWASWCSPCQQALPMYDKFRNEFSRDDFEILAINLDEEISDAKEFLKEHPLSYPVLYDGKSEIAKRFDLKGMPSSYVIDRKGMVRYQHVGFTAKTLDRMRQQIHHLVDEKLHAP